MKLSLIILLAAGLKAGAQDGLQDAFQREYVYLTSQKEALNRQRGQMDKTFSEKTARAKAQVQELQRKLTQLTAANDERHEQLVGLEKQKKELQKRGTSLESTFKKATQALYDFNQGLKFETAKDRPEVTVPENMATPDLAPLFDGAVSSLNSASRRETFQGYYLDGNGDLKAGQVTRLGRVAAFVENQDGRFLLGPSGAGALKVLEPAAKNSVFVFENLNEAARVQKPATWLESLADLGPILFLGVMLMMVMALFLVLVRI